MANARGTSVRCSWCRFYYPARPASGTCDNCGGPLPSPSGEERGDGPPPAPRTLPSAYRRSVMLGRNVLAILGLVFSSFGGLFMLIGVFLFATAGHSHAAVPLLLSFGGFGLLFGAMGLPMLLVGRGRGKRKLAALEHGVAAEGEITSVWLNRSVQINGRSPWVIDFTFTTTSGPTTGSAETFQPPAGEREVGDKVWVVFLPSDADVSTLWPPVA